MLLKNPKKNLRKSAKSARAKKNGTAQRQKAPCSAVL